MAAVFLMFGILAGGAATWWIVQNHLESKIRHTEGEALTLKEQIITLRAQAAIAEKTLTEERANHSAAISQMALSFKKGILILATAYFGVGLVLGGTSGWFGATWKWDSKENAEKSELTMKAGLAELKVELLEKELEQFRKNIGFFEHAIREEQVARAVALTKLEILLESVISQKTGGGFMLDEQKLKKNLRDKIEPAYQDRPILQSPQRP